MTRTLPAVGAGKALAADELLPLVRLYEEWERPAKAAEWRGRGEDSDLPTSRPDPTAGGGR
ncbi:MAG: hypothetical protein L0323_16775 [Planctomycetes bacterium]|nr:hypothetical protein [Planctomycetota bacterium]